MKKDNLYIVMPAYNEQDTIGEVVNEWYDVVNKIGEDSRLVVVNDGSKDDTLKILKNLQEDKPQLVVLDKKNSGHGSTVVYGYNYAISKSPAYIFQTDSDGQTLASEFWQFWDHRNEYDAQFGFRKKREDGLSRWIVTKTLRFIVWGIFKTWVTDANTPYRLMKTTVLEEALKYVPDDYNLPNVIISTYIVKKKFNYRFERVTFRPRQGGVNSINIKSISKIGKNALGDFKAIAKHINQGQPFRR